MIISMGSGKGKTRRARSNVALESAAPTNVLLDWTKEWRNMDGQFHRVGGPAVVREDGKKEWYQDGKLHREDGPAVEHANGRKEWYLNGEKHREGAPAVVYEDGVGEVWYLHGQMHREGGPAYTDSSGAERWYSHGELHREDGRSRRGCPCRRGPGSIHWRRLH